MSNEPIYRLLDTERDLDDVQRLWREVGWIDKVPDPFLPDAFAVGRTLVAEIEETVECAVLTVPGEIRYQHSDLPLCAVAAVTTSHIARRLGLAKQLTARSLAHAGEQGAAVAALGMFDQGFYDKLGFANASYDHRLVFDPATLNLDVPYRAPRRLTIDDYELMHTAMASRLRAHGGCVLSSPLTLKAELGWVEGGFGLGFHGAAGQSPTTELTHFLWLQPDKEHGPVRVVLIAYRTIPQLLELLGVLQSLADQVYSVGMVEPPELQLQTLLRQPFRMRNLTKDSRHANSHRAFTWWQLRVMDVAACVAARSYEGPPVRFNLQLEDPLTGLLDGSDVTWRGCGGYYEVTLAQHSSAQHKPDAQALDPLLPLVQANVNTFTRLLFGIMPATSLAAVEGLQLPSALLPLLDAALNLPPTQATWDF
jgi:hypothetical protein